MSSRIGTSADRRAARGRARPLVAASALTLLLAALLGVAGFVTVDAGGTERVRSAIFVWRFVAAGMRAAPLQGMALVYTVALAIAVSGFFVLLWLAISVDAPPDVDARDSRAAAALRDLGSALGRMAPIGSRAARISVAATVALAAFAAWKMGLFAPLRIWGVPNTFASFDHPFHVARAETLVRSLAHGRVLRWVANHQGGYPAEFYPFGFAWVEALLWAIAGGRVAIPIVHRVAVILLFLTPGVLFAAITRRDGWPPVVALAAFALHIAVPGDMWAGGYGELVLVGLVANVSAAIAVVASMVAAHDALIRGRPAPTAIAAAAAAAAIWCNPRSGLGLVVCVGAAWLVAVRQVPWRPATIRLIGIAALAALLAAPELVSLARFQSLYFFIRYTGYASSLDYVAASIDAVSTPAFVLAIVGAVAAFRLGRRRSLTATITVALAVYVAVTLAFTFGASSAIEQLETTRLMPVQRLLMIYLAAVGLHVVADLVFQHWRVPRGGPAWTELAVVAVLLVVSVGPQRLLPYWSRGLYAVQWSAVPEMATFQQVLTVADRQAPRGTAILVVGSAMAGHQQLWAPARLDRMFFYDEWMWYWHRRHRGPYDPSRTSKYDPERIGEIFRRDYLDRNAIGAVVVAAAAQPQADAAPALRRVFGGAYGVYSVVDPVTAVTLAGRAPDTLTIDNEEMAAAGSSAGGEALIRRNWFPRWRARVNGTPAPIVQTDDGYMRVAIPAGPVDLRLTYALERSDVAARAAAAVGVAVMLALLWPRGHETPTPTAVPT